jgi:hypothetical protein
MINIGHGFPLPDLAIGCFQDQITLRIDLYLIHPVEPELDYPGAAVKVRQLAINTAPGKKDVQV